MCVILANGVDGGTRKSSSSVPRVDRVIPPQPQRGGAGKGQARADQVLTTRVGLQLPDILTFEEWERAGRQLAGVLDSSSWWLGDWLTYGKDHYTDRYQQGLRTAGLRYQTLRNYAWVARRFEVSRRRARLTFQHHAEVASLPVEGQDEWLSRAEELSWTTKQLRTALRESRGGEVEKVESPSSVRQLAVPVDRFERWLRAAEHSGAEVDEWVLATLDSAAELVFGANVEVLAARPAAPREAVPREAVPSAG